jgi:purine-nucleoside phosphorylase
MSTVHEVLVAIHCGIKVIGFSLITNKCVLDYESREEANHQEVLEAANNRAKDFEKLIENVVDKLEKL